MISNITITLDIRPRERGGRLRRPSLPAYAQWHAREAALCTPTCSEPWESPASAWALRRGSCAEPGSGEFLLLLPAS
jgi:hypothetical protein